MPSRIQKSQSAADLQRLAMNIARGEIQSDQAVRISVAGTSMKPTLMPGDLIQVEAVMLESLPPGALVTFITNGGAMTHRLVSNERDGLLTKGDNMRRFDPKIPHARVVGLVTSLTRGPVTRATLPGRRAKLVAKASALEGRYMEKLNRENSSPRWSRLFGLPLRLAVYLFSVLESL